jgi:hypothetical protein
MKTYLVIPILVVAGALSVGKLTSAPVPHHSTAAKECSDCGCSGPDKGGGCPEEKGKTCKCGKK